MEVPQRIGTDAVMALIFGPIGQISPVWAGTGQTERPGPAGLLPFGVPPFLAGVQKDLDCPGDEGFCLFAAVPRFHKARQRGLVTAGNARIGTGPEILDMDFLDQFRPVGQDAGRPQFVVQIGPEIFQSCPHGAVEDQDALAVQNLFQCTFHFLSPLVTVLSFHRHRPISDDRRIFPSFLRRQETEPEIIEQAEDFFPLRDDE